MAAKARTSNAADEAGWNTTHDTNSTHSLKVQRVASISTHPAIAILTRNLHFVAL